jgi:glycosyltransferase involved in cell wall biosynthesis
MLSIILVAKDAASFIEDAIAQAQQAAEETGARVVAVDGHSNDGTWETLRQQTGWTVRQQHTPGLAAARNQAIELADTELIAFLDADDQWLPGKLTTQLEHLRQSPKTEIVSCLLRRVGDGEGDTLHHALTPSGCVIRRSVFDKVGLFNSRYELACDHEWFMRTRQLGVPTEILPSCLMHKRIHDQNLSRDRTLYRRELFEILRTGG